MENKDNRRHFFGPDEETVYYIKSPTAEDIRGADWQYSKTYTQCLVEGITTSAEMLDILNRRGIIGPEFERRAAELSNNLGNAIDNLDAAEDMESKRELAIQVAKAREELYQWNQRLSGPMNNTAEQISDDARLEYLTSVLVVKEDNSKVWNNYDAYLKEKSQGLALRSRFEVMLFLQGLDSDFLDQTPEAQAMKEIESEILQKAEDAIRAAEAIIEEEEASIVEEPEMNLEEVEVKKDNSKTKKSKDKKSKK